MGYCSFSVSLAVLVWLFFTVIWYDRVTAVVLPTCFVLQYSLRFSRLTETLGSVVSVSEMCSSVALGRRKVLPTKVLSNVTVA